MLSDIIRQYLSLYPGETRNLKVLLKQAAEEQQLFGKHNYEGHVTGSGIVLSPDRKKLLLIYHPTFVRWQQPGGHWEAEEMGPWLTAKRETEEETGVKLGEIIASGKEFIPIQIDSHLVPNVPPKYEPEHYHHDFRYGFIAEDEKVNMTDMVIKKAQWVPIEEVDEPLKTAALRLIGLLKG